MSKFNKSKKAKRKEADSKITEEVSKESINWFPGHMLKAINKIKSRLKMVDIVIEVRDARSPLVTGNRSVHKQMGEKSRLIVINKSDLAKPEILKLWKEWFLKQGEPFVFINCFDKNSLNQILKLSRDIVHAKRIKSNPDDEVKTNLRLMIIGLPNTGKSTIINKLANRNATQVADRPGHTKHQLWVVINKDLELLDTPGVMPPEIEKEEHGLWLSALHAIPDKIVTPGVPACFIVEHLLKTKSSEFKERYKLESFDLDLIGALDQIAKTRGCIRQKNEYDYERAYTIILADFRNGDLGPVSFGLPPE